MPWFASAADRLLMAALESWHVYAQEEVDRIGGWRDCSSLPPDLWDPQAFWHWEVSTTAILAHLCEHYPRMDPQPLQDLHGWMADWNRERSAARLPPQPVLTSVFERAEQLVLTLRRLVLARVRLQPSPPGGAGPRGTAIQVDPEKTPPWEAWDGWDEVQPLPRRLLNFMWGREEATLVDLEELVWGRDGLSDNAVRVALGKANTYLGAHNHPRQLSKVKGQPIILWA